MRIGSEVEGRICRGAGGEQTIQDGNVIRFYCVNNAKCNMISINSLYVLLASDAVSGQRRVTDYFP